ncbi:MAG: hypothetical protein GXY47_00880 [Acidobacteria bacterium]|nr:hypothetical protein [Acidobacteriota bacterium]
MRRIPLVLTMVLFSGLPWAAAQPAAKPACDRACLESYIDRYLEAMDADKPSLELFTRDCRFTENGVRLPLGGEGLWVNMSGKGTYRFYVPDIETQQVAFIGTVREGADMVAVAIRLKIAGDRISEAEQLVIRPERAAPSAPGAPSFPPTGESVEKMGSPHPVYLEVIPESERPSREEMIKTANYYFTGMQKNDGKGYYPFSDDCHRIENGLPSTNVPLREGETRPDPKTAKTYSATWSCREQFESGLLNFVSRIRDRRFVAVDRERGIVFAFGFFDHHDINWTWQLAELFKIEKGQIRRIEAVFHRSAFGMNSGWSTYEQGISDALQIVY